MPAFKLTDSYIESINKNPSLILPLVLDEINDIRIAIGIGEGKIPELPKAIPGNAKQCVLARALSNGWESHVDGGRIKLEHVNDPGIDFEKIGQKLRDMGFMASVWEPMAYDRMTDSYKPSRDSEGHAIIEFSHTRVTELMIQLFDAEAFTELIDWEGINGYSPYQPTTNRGFNAKAVWEGEQAKKAIEDGPLS